MVLMGVCKGISSGRRKKLEEANSRVVNKFFLTWEINFVMKRRVDQATKV